MLSRYNSSFSPPFPLPPVLQAEPAGIESECLIPVKSSKLFQQPVKFSGKQALRSFSVNGDVWVVPEGRGTLQRFAEAALMTWQPIANENFSN